MQSGRDWRGIPTVTDDLAPIFSAIERIQADCRRRNIDKGAVAANNRARLKRWSPECARMIEQLRERGMFGRVVLLEVPE